MGTKFDITISFEDGTIMQGSGEGVVQGSAPTPSPSPPAPAPEPPSPAPAPPRILALSLGEILYEGARGTDNFAPTWVRLAPGEEYTLLVGGDGWGFDEGGAKHSLVVSKMSWDQENADWAFQDIYSGDGKCYGPLAVEPAGTVLAFIGPGSMFQSCRNAALWVSKDGGRTWAKRWEVPNEWGICLPSGIQHGPNNLYAPGGRPWFVCPVVHQADWDVWKPGEFLLMRGPADRRYGRRDGWDFWTGDGWGPRGAAKPILRDPKGAMMANVNFWPELNAYTLTTEYTQRWEGNFSLFVNEGMFAGWRKIQEGREFGGKQSFFWPIIQQWSRPDRLLIVPNGRGEGPGGDQFTLRKGRLILSHAQDTDVP